MPIAFRESVKSALKFSHIVSAFVSVFSFSSLWVFNFLNVRCSENQLRSRKHYSRNRTCFDWTLHPSVQHSSSEFPFKKRKKKKDERLIFLIFHVMLEPWAIGAVSEWPSANCKTDWTEAMFVFAKFELLWAFHDQLQNGLKCRSTYEYFLSFIKTN